MLKGSHYEWNRNNICVMLDHFPLIMHVKSKLSPPLGQGHACMSVAPQRSLSQAIWSGPATDLPEVNCISKSFISVAGGPCTSNTVMSNEGLSIKVLSFSTDRKCKDTEFTRSNLIT